MRNPHFIIQLDCSRLSSFLLKQLEAHFQQELSIHKKHNLDLEVKFYQQQISKIGTELHKRRRQNN